MKEKIKILVLGILIGAVVTAGIFILLKKDNSNQAPNMNREMMQFDETNMPSDMKERKGRDKSSSNEVESSKTEMEGTSEKTENPVAEDSNVNSAVNSKTDSSNAE